jgi:hypothetical protein
MKKDMTEYIYYAEQWSIREKEIQQGGISPTNSSADDKKRP